jgi:lipopolysaccharide/colanic/teichoic acid biosynthesis glycosyltransferase
MKRFIDLLLVVLTLPLWLPLFFLVAILVFIVEGRPVFFTQERAGLKGKTFVLFKFRSMRKETGDKEEDTDEKRLTRLGQFLRKTSLDELPQLFNVLGGSMSLVGPRPLPVRYLPRYSKEQARRHEVRPGITGWAQVNGRNTLDWNTKFEYDVWYVDNHSLSLDIKIMFMTFSSVLRKDGISAENSATMTEFLG